jgi:glycosyltransferase involved in cell wall biosynthesis
MLRALDRAARVFSVADSLRRHMVGLGADPERIEVVGNGVDSARFAPLPRGEARRGLDIHAHAPVLVSVGGLVERKGFHRVIDCLPSLRQRHPGLQYLVVGGASAEGDWGTRLQAQVEALNLQDTVRFLGPLPPDQLRGPLSAADVFVLATSNEGWANVFLEAMACGLPVVTTDVGGNPEVVLHESLGTIVPFGDSAALERALDAALRRSWDRGQIREYAQQNDWETRVDQLCKAFESVLKSEPGRPIPLAMENANRGRN